MKKNNETYLLGLSNDHDNRASRVKAVLVS